MFSVLHARLLPRIALRSPVSLLVRRSAAAPRANLSRTFLTGTSRLELPAKSTRKTTPTDKKTVAKTGKKPAKKRERKAVRKTAAKKKVVRKKKATEKATAKDPAKFRLAANQKPPRRPGDGRMLFIGNFLRARERGTLFDSQQSMREASAQYNNLSAEEKLDYRSRSLALKQEWEIAYEKWYSAMDPKIIRAFNRSRRLKGKSRLHRPASLPKRPAGAFLRFLSGFQDSSLRLPDRSKAAGAAWRALPDAEKKQYMEAARADMAKWKQEHSAH